MAVPVIAATATSQGGSSGTTNQFSCTLPAHSAGDLLVVTINWTSDASNNGSQPTPSAGWNCTNRFAVGSDVWRSHMLAWKVAESDAEACTIQAYNTTYWSCGCVAMTVTGAASPYEVDWRHAAGSTTAASASTAACPTPTVDYDDSLVLYGVDSNRASLAATTPSGAVAVANRQGESGSVYVARYNGAASAGTAPAATWTGLTDWHYKRPWTLVIPPDTVTARSPRIKDTLGGGVYDSSSPYTHTGVAPTCENGDLLVLFVNISLVGSSTTLTPGSVAGWTEVFNLPGAPAIACYTKIADGNDAPAMSWTGGTASLRYRMLSITGAGTSLLSETAGFTTDGVSTESPAVASTADGSLVLRFMAANGKQEPIYSSSYDGVVHQYMLANDATQCILVDRGVSSGGAVSALTWANSSTLRRAAATLVIPPPSSPGGGFVRYRTIRNPSQLAGPASAGQRLVIF